MQTNSKSFPIQLTEKSQVEGVEWDKLEFGKIFSDHMFIMEYADGSWSNGEIVPFQAIPMLMK